MTTTRRASAAAAAAAAAAELPVKERATRSRPAQKTSRAAAGSVKPSNKDVSDEAKNQSDSTVMETGANTRKRARATQQQDAAVPASEVNNSSDIDGKNNANSDPQDTTRRTRGRPRKSAAPAQDDGAPTAAAEPSAIMEKEPTQEPPAKRQRRGGRKSKADTAAAPKSPKDAANAPPASGAPLAGASAATAEPQVPAADLVGPPDTVQPIAPVPVAVALAAEASHQLQPAEQPELQQKPLAPAAPLAPQPASPPPPPAPPRSPLGQRLPQMTSPQRKPLGTNNVSGCILPGAAPATAAAAQPPALIPGSPKQLRSADQPTKPDAAALELEQDLVQIRRLLRPGALAGPVISSATAAADAAAAKGAGGGGAAGAGDGVSGAAEPAARSAQFKELFGMVSDCSSTGRGSAIYVSGLPGTGKTYTVSKVLAALPGLAASSGASGAGGVSFCCATLNCMALDDPAKLYGRLQNELLRDATAEPGNPRMDLLDLPTPSDAAAAHDSLLSTLHKLSVIQPGAAGGAGAKAKGGTKRGRGGAAAARSAGQGKAEGPRRRVFVVVLDEVDRLLRRRDGGEELARLFQLPAVPGLSLVLLAVANSLDLTERMMPLLRARGLAPRHMVFTAYSRPQVLAILQAQLAAHPRGPRLFEAAALDMVAKSVSSSSGDLRQALKACRTALDVLLDNNRANPAAARSSVGIREVHTALQRISSQGNGQSAMVAKIKGLPPQQQLVLLALATAVGARAAADGGAAGASSFQPGSALFTGSRPKFADTVAFREIGNQAGAGPANNPGACFDGPAAPTPAKAGRAGGAAGAAAASTPTASRLRGVTGPGGGGAGTPGSCRSGAGGAPPSRTPASILAGDAGLALSLADVYGQYTALCRQLDIPAMSESAFRTDALPGLDCDGLLRVTEGRTPAATRLSLRAMVRDVQAALADNVMFKRLMGAKAPAPAAVGPVPVRA